MLVSKDKMKKYVVFTDEEIGVPGKYQNKLNTVVAYVIIVR